MVTAAKKKELKKGALSYGVAFILCAMAAIFRYITGNDVMSLTVFRSKTLGDMTGEKGVYSLWPISHFILYVFLGYLAPSWWWLWICLGIAWEIVEYACGLLVRNLQSKEGTANLGKKAEKMFMPQYGEEWVSGSQSDVLFNIAGLGLGILLTKLCKSEYRETFNKNRGLSLKVIYYSGDNISSTSSPIHMDKDHYDQPWLLSSVLAS